mgnify:CR=1 FL=1
MEYRIIGDSCLDLTDDLKNRENVAIVPLTLQVDGVNYVDDSSFDQKARHRNILKKPMGMTK